MVSQSMITLDKILVELLDPGTSPEKALQLLSTSLFAPKVYSERHKEPMVIFLAYIRFVMNKHPGGNVEGIWEEILQKAFTYLMIDIIIYYYIEQFRANYPPNIFAWLVPALRDDIFDWVYKVLRNHNMCLNPYVRLDIFRLNSKLGNSRPPYSNMAICQILESLSDTFWYTICEVNPQRFYPSADEYDPMFDVCDMRFMLTLVEEDIAYEHINDINFISNVIRLTGVFATRIGDDPAHYKDLMSCCNIINFLYLSKRIDNDLSITCQSLRPYLLETAREITATAIFSKGRVADWDDVASLLSVRDILVGSCDLSPKPCNLPRLLLLRQMHGSRQVRQHALLMGDMDWIFNNEEE